MATTAGENTPCRGREQSPKRVERREARHTPESAGASSTNSRIRRRRDVKTVNSGYRTRRGCLSISCEWQLSVARISEIKDLGPAFGGCPEFTCLSSLQGNEGSGFLATKDPIAPLTRTLGGIEANGCAMHACGVESASERPPTAQVVAARYDGRRSGCERACR